jgi:hypothetical protein
MKKTEDEVITLREEREHYKNETAAQKLRRLKRELRDSISFEKAIVDNADKREKHRVKLRRQIEKMS